ncbi:mrp protein, putative [Trichomonas vaginalis G3]|uniref:Mrp protein, putative n=1 Tax=Trichomonas vaginalis (strain ATCC PRA-98 / G3) TaxID=412133 RepID=A2F0N4_TRIV3|nr:NUBPL iron-transfer P-loop NTPase (ParA) family [Trichomonas vaginalis G3]EAY01549.1 mrp protein, putative [Trichomonas vaginalis G3]KAI5485671.1 NUBPL iron-transfer P-loop NTPase (ParA) family [Trichomonas vaginalis G3]|eukprot:XP_001330320.1 mrp protein [Trichomonas vaginalis G3]
MLTSAFKRFAGQETILKALARTDVDKFIEGIDRIVVTVGAKGGVGKSTVAVNTALALADIDNTAGVLDLDLFAPSVPQLCNTVTNNLQLSKEKNFLPISAYGIETISVGNGTERDQALLWNSQFIPKLVEQLSKKSEWSNLDYLIVDVPSGSIEILSALNDHVHIDGAIVVTGCDQLSQTSTLRTIDALHKLKIPVSGIVKNFDNERCMHCGTPIKHKQPADAIDVSRETNVDVLTSIPRENAIAISGEKGFPVVLSDPNSNGAAAFRQLARKIMAKVPKRTEEQLKQILKERDEKRKQQEELLRKIEEEYRKQIEEEKKNMAKAEEKKTEEKKVENK